MTRMRKGEISPRDRAIIGARESGRTYADIAAEYGLSPVRIPQIIDRARWYDQRRNDPL